MTTSIIVTPKFLLMTMKTIAKNIIMFTAVVTALPTAMLAFSLLMLLWVPTVQLARLLERLTHKVMDAINWLWDPITMVLTLPRS